MCCDHNYGRHYTQLKGFVPKVSKIYCFERRFLRKIEKVELFGTSMQVLLAAVLISGQTHKSQYSL